MATTSSLIATAPTATIEQVQTFLMKKNAAARLHSLVPFYFAYGKLIGINPVFSICQSCLEQHYLTYDYCLLTPDMKNTAGIKRSDEEIAAYFNEHPEDKVKGSDIIKECHKTFNRWTESVCAQIDHAALYAGLPSFPREDTYDPRHFKWCFGLGKTINEFCTHYSTASYAIKLAQFMTEVENTVPAEVSVTMDKEVEKDVLSMIEELTQKYGAVSAQPIAADILYRVRSSWEDSASQKGAFTNFNNALDCAKQNQLNIYDSKGQCVYIYTIDYETMYKTFNASYLSMMKLYNETQQKLKAIKDLILAE